MSVMGIVGGLVLACLTSGCQLVFDLTPAPDAPEGDGPASSKRVFVTSKKFTGALGGLGGADMKCTDAGSILGGTYRAWLSIEQLSAPERMDRANIPYRLVDADQTLVADEFIGLTLGTLAHQIDITETGDPVGTQGSLDCQSGTGVWTNTDPAGVTGGPNDCDDWTIGDDTETGNAGTTKAMTGAWTDDTSCRGIPCTEEMSLYCIEQ